VSTDAADLSTGNKDVLKEIISNASSYIHAQFPGVLIVPTIGNNDYWFHDQSPYETDKAEYYGFLYDQWFPG
jgi:hypothetical protein